MISKSLAVDLKPENIIVLAIHPGWVVTDMGGPNATINTVTSTTSMISVIQKSELSNTGSFYNYDGQILPY